MQYVYFNFQYFLKLYKIRYMSYTGGFFYHQTEHGSFIGERGCILRYASWQSLCSVYRQKKRILFSRM